MTIQVLGSAYRQLKNMRTPMVFGYVPQDEAEAEADEEVEEKEGAHWETEAAGDAPGMAAAIGLRGRRKLKRLRGEHETVLRFKLFKGAPLRDLDGGVRTTTPTAMLGRLNRKYVRVVSLIRLQWKRLRSKARAQRMRERKLKRTRREEEAKLRRDEAMWRSPELVHEGERGGQVAGVLHVRSMLDETGEDLSAGPGPAVGSSGDAAGPRSEASRE